MAAGSGSDFLLAVGDGGSPEMFTNTVAACRGNTFNRAGEAVDITAKDSLGIRQLLDGGGVKSATISGAGIFKGSAGETALEANYEDQELHNYRITYPDASTYTFAAQVTQLEVTGDYNGAQQFSFTLEVSGTITPA